MSRLDAVSAEQGPSLTERASGRHVSPANADAQQMEMIMPGVRSTGEARYGTLSAASEV